MTEIMKALVYKQTLRSPDDDAFFFMELNTAEAQAISGQFQGTLQSPIINALKTDLCKTTLTQPHMPDVLSEAVTDAAGSSLREDSRITIYMYQHSISLLH